MPRKKMPPRRELTEEAVKSIAYICGAHSGAAQAIANAQARRAAGQTVRFYKYDGGPLVVEGTPAPAPQIDGAQAP